MDKLIELLNEYQKENKRQIFYSYNKDLDFFECGSVSGIETYGDSTCNIISKKFGFIKWLIDNDKINLNDSKLLDLSTELGCAVSSDIVIMVLSIQDNPIEFLCSVLK